MVKTQVQIPDDLYRRAKEIAATHEMSFADVVRRGLELMSSLYPGRPAEPEAWSPPRITRESRWNGLTAEQLRDLANERE